MRAIKVVNRCEHWTLARLWLAQCLVPASVCCGPRPRHAQRPVRRRHGRDLCHRATRATGPIHGVESDRCAGRWRSWRDMQHGEPHADGDDLHHADISERRR